jgi:PRTRC genetic system protein C
LEGVAASIRAEPMILGLCMIAESLIDGGAGKPNSAFPRNVPIVPERKMNMSTLKAEALAREFHYNGVRIPDPGPEMTVEQVRDLLTPNYPEIATASVSGPEAASSVLRYTFSRAIGSKG